MAYTNYIMLTEQKFHSLGTSLQIQRGTFFRNRICGLLFLRFPYHFLLANLSYKSPPVVRRVLSQLLGHVMGEMMLSDPKKLPMKDEATKRYGLDKSG
ncbi:hypothetical protein CDAR_530911 [Caerostris darwini]|uniref:Uncharacterized protein n=1 Tax=Caerostris darwini TaxID=1538125 RepID=A0AAV4VSD0_9ARAC|nr:hypothetical protein CDAR_530911 [Caerostris darwini]